MAYDVAVVGGGVVGWSTAWHLLRREPKLKVAVFDPHPQQQSSRRGTGGVRCQFGSELNIRLSLNSIRQFERFKDEVGHDINFRQVGYLLLTADPAKVEGMERAVELQKSLGVPVQTLTRDEVHGWAPYLFHADILFATFCGIDGTLDGPEVVAGYRNASLALGAEEITEAAVRVSANEVQVTNQTVEAKHVVFAAGHWSGRFGFNLPVEPERHQLYARSDSAGIPDEAPLIIDCDTSFHFRRKGEGLLMGYHDHGLALSPCNFDAAPHFDVSVYFRMRPMVKKRCPQLFEDYKEIDGWSGYYAVTPDRQPIIGFVDGVLVATGFCGHGIMHSPASGQLVSEIILDGKPSIDLSELAPDRFKKGTVSVEQMVF